MNGIPIELLAVVIVALASIITNALSWFFNYRNTRMKFETETRARYIQEVLRDHYKVHNFLTQMEGTPVMDVFSNASAEINKIMNEHPYNFKATIIYKWINIYESITLLEENREECALKIRGFNDDIWARIEYFESEYEKMMGLEVGPPVSND